MNVNYPYPHNTETKRGKIQAVFLNFRKKKRKISGLGRSFTPSTRGEKWASSDINPFPT